MDVTQVKNCLICLLLLVFNLGCSSSSDSSEPARKLKLPTGKCEAQVISGSYVVEWTSGKVTVANAVNSEELIQNFITPNNTLIKRVEHNIKFEKSAPTRSQCRAAGADNWGIAQTESASAWSKGIYGDEVVVAVIDSGVDLSHPLLRNRIYINEGESGLDSDGNDKSSNGIDDDDNGYIDDISGYDFLKDSPRVVDNEGHGTHVAGIIAAEHRDTAHNTGDVQGVAPGAKILPLDFINDFGSLDGAIAAIEYARSMKARVINASWGGNDCSEILRDRIASLEDDNILFVAAAGNSGNNLDSFPEYPAAYQLSGQLTVGAIGPFENMAHYTNYSQNSVHLFAPGSQIESTFPGNRSVCLDGTSMATPFVTGAAALVIGENPELNVQQVRSILLNAIKSDINLLSIHAGSLNLSNIF